MDLRRLVAEPALIVVAPAIAAFIGARTGIAAARGNGVHATRHRFGVRMRNVIDGAEPQLAERVGTPAVSDLVAGDSACVAIAGADRRESQRAAHPDRRP